MTSVLKYGVQYGLQASLSPPPCRLHAMRVTRVHQAFTVNPLSSPPTNFTYRLGSVFVKYSSQLIIIQPPPVIGATVDSRSSFAGATPGLRITRPPPPLAHHALVVYV
jgi:hypothetical protein